MWAVVSIWALQRVRERGGGGLVKDTCGLTNRSLQGWRLSPNDDAVACALRLSLLWLAQTHFPWIRVPALVEILGLKPSEIQQDALWVS